MRQNIRQMGRGGIELLTHGGWEGKRRKREREGEREREREREGAGDKAHAQ
jgi:hypothetical protein